MSLLVGPPPSLLGDVISGSPLLAQLRRLLRFLLPPFGLMERPAEIAFEWVRHAFLLRPFANSFPNIQNITYSLNLLLPKLLRFDNKFANRRESTYCIETSDATFVGHFDPATESTMISPLRH